jgi:zinc transport system permease protein
MTATAMHGLVLFMDADIHWLDRLIYAFNENFADSSFFSSPMQVRALVALVLVSVCSGAVGSLVIGGRMAFFSDALAHCAFAGVSLGFLLFETLLAPYRPAGEFWSWVTPVMVIFGMSVGAGIAFVRTRSGLASDTVIGVFFAACIGLYALLRNLILSRKLFDLEDFLFGNPLFASANDLIALLCLVVVTAVVLVCIYNHLLLTNFNPSLARSRRIRVHLSNYIFVMLLALIVNLCLRAVGVLLINALLIVPAATAANVSRNLRQLFWVTIILCLGVSLAGLASSWELGARYNVNVGIPGAIVLLSVFFFVVSLFMGPLVKNRRAAGRPDRLAKTVG